VLPFIDKSGQAPALAQPITELVEGELARSRRVKIVSYIQSEENTRIFLELRRQAELKDVKAINPETIQDVSHTWGVDALLIGNITDVQSAFNVSCRLYDVSTGAVIDGAAANALINKSDIGSPNSFSGDRVSPHGSMTRNKWDGFVKKYQLGMIRRQPLTASNVLGMLGVADEKSQNDSVWTYYDTSGNAYRITFTLSTRVVDVVRP
jgi:hypothetical protein